MTYSFNIILIKLFLLLSFTISQDQVIGPPVKKISNSSITKISFSSSGGRSGQYEKLDISPSSIIYIQGRNDTEKSVKERTVKAFWTSLTKAINLNNFDKIKSDPGHALYDGIDITITVERGTEKHTIVNGSADHLNYDSIKSFTALLEKKLGSLRSKIIW